MKPFYLYLCITKTKKHKKMKEYKKELTLTVEELNALGMNFEFTVNSIMNNGCSPERFEIIKKLKERLDSCK